MTPHNGTRFPVHCPDPEEERLDLLLDRLTSVARLLAWTAMFALCAVLIWLVMANAAHAGDPKAAARAIGNAGTAAAGAIARDASNAGTVPGYAGTNVPERSLTASGMQDAARARLADPDDPGRQRRAGGDRGDDPDGRPERPLSVSDPGRPCAARDYRRRSRRTSAHGADGLASGGVTECGAGLEDAQAGGACGSVR